MSSKTNKNENENNNPFSLHREGDDGIIRRNPFPIIHEDISTDNANSDNGISSEQRQVYNIDYDAENATREVITTPFQSNVTDQRTSNDIFYNQNLLSTTALTISRDIDSGRITKPLSEYDINLNNSVSRNINTSTGIFQKTYRYGSKSISRSEFSKEMLGDVDPLDSVKEEDGADDVTSEEGDENYYMKMAKSVVQPVYSYYNKYLASSASNTYHQLHQQIILLTLVTVLLYYSSPAILEPFLSKPPEWSWSDVNNRRLDGRKCAMNYFIEKQAPDEYDPDFKEIVIDDGNGGGADKSKQKDKKKDKKGDKDDSKKKEKKKKKEKVIKKLKPAEIAPGGTYRTKGQVHVVGRFIASVADAFRSNITVHQHLIFAGVRDSGHLAEKAMIYWPPRGNNKIIVHLIAADQDDLKNSTDDKEDNIENDNDDPLQYQYLHEIENRFKGNGQILIYDKHGIAGSVLEDKEDDDDYDAPEDDEIREIAKHIKSHGKSGNTMDVTSIIKPFQDQYDDEALMVPYLHVDGVKMEQQLEVLSSAVPLLESRTIIAVGIEHAPDTDVFTLISFFKNVGYKTFFLGSRQIARIDHLCEEILLDVLKHPSITPPLPNTLRMILHKLGMMDLPVVNWKKLHDDLFEKQMSNMTNNNFMTKRNVMSRRSYPPFFIAMPGDLAHRQAMQIQHMYDLFGGYDSGGGQIKTANDRKAPGKK